MSCPPNIWNGLYALSQHGLQSDAAIKSWFGPHIAGCITGGAPTRPEVLAWARKMLWPIPVDDSYGNTEVGSLTRNGAPAPGVEIKLVHLPEQGLTHPLGEIWVRARAGLAAAGYYKAPEATAEAFLPERWFRTGDVGRVSLDARGKAVYEILDRVSAVVGLAGGRLLRPSAVVRIRSLSARPYGLIIGCPCGLLVTGGCARA
jgi:long-chain acyl-CoA synthetase